MFIHIFSIYYYTSLLPIPLGKTCYLTRDELRVIYNRPGCSPPLPCHTPLPRVGSGHPSLLILFAIPICPQEAELVLLARESPQAIIIWPWTNHQEEKTPINDVS